MGDQLFRARIYSEKYLLPIGIVSVFLVIGLLLHFFVSGESDRVIKEETLSGVVAGAHQITPTHTSPTIVLLVEIQNGEKVNLLLPRQSATVAGQRVRIRRIETEKGYIDYEFISAESKR